MLREITDGAGRSGEELSLRALLSPELDPLFWQAPRAGVDSAWYGHVPFAHWLVCVLRPRVLVELGTHDGVSYSAFCGAVLRERMGARCFAIGTSCQGDDDVGHAGTDMFEAFRAFHDLRYGSFSSLLRAGSDEALPYIRDESVDLLHIDWLHSYEALKETFQSWFRKLSPRAVVLFHDTNVRERGFGVWRFWTELRPEYPHFEFLHSEGLGVLLVGQAQPAVLKALVGLDARKTHTVRQRFAELGLRFTILEQARHSALNRERLSADGELLRAQQRIQQLDAQMRDTTHRLEGLTCELLAARLDAERRRAALEVIQNSRSWRAEEASRKLGRRLRALLRIS